MHCALLLMRVTGKNTETYIMIIMTLQWHKACLNNSDSLLTLNNCLPDS
jgi:hypothetical protein